MLGAALVALAATHLVAVVISLGLHYLAFASMVQLSFSSLFR